MIARALLARCRRLPCTLMTASLPLPWQCATQPPYCGRGPLQITGLKNYDFCAAHPACDCPDISDDVEKPATDATVGFGTAACVWAGVFGYSLSQLVDGSRAQPAPAKNAQRQPTRHFLTDL